MKSTTKREMYGISELSQIIPLKAELEYLRTRAESSVNDISEMLYFKELIEFRYEQYTSLVSFIDSVPDSEMRVVLRMRFIEGLTHQQISFRIGRFDESYARRMIKNFLTKSDKNTLDSTHLS